MNLMRQIFLEVKLDCTPRYMLIPSQLRRNNQLPSVLYPQSLSYTTACTDEHN